MMRRLSYLLLALLVFAACSKEGQWDGPVIQLTLVTDELLETKAGQDGTRDGVYNFNENVINVVDFFFYPGEDTDSPASFHIRKSDQEKQTTYFSQLELTWEQLDKIFPIDKGYRKAKVVAIVNYDGELVNDEENLNGTSLPELEQKGFVSDFANASHIQNHFIMSGSEVLNLRGRNQSVVAAATVRLSRYACKLTVGVNVSSEINQNGEVWRPMLEGMELYLVNGVKNATLGGEAALQDYQYFDYNPLPFAYKDGDVIRFYFEKEDGYYITYPTYMYPQHWDYGSKNEPYVKLVIPWARQAGEGIQSTQRQYYYKLFLPTALSEEEGGLSSGGCFIRNNWYHINVNVDILGTDNDDAAVTVDGKVYIYDWQDKDVVIKMAEIGRARYLSVEQPTYNLYNINESRFAYVSSHPVEIANLCVTRPYYGTEPVGKNLSTGGKVCQGGPEGAIYPPNSKYVLYDNDKDNIYHADNPDASWLVDEGDAIRFKHNLVADYELTSFDYSPYTIRYTLQHADHRDDAVYSQDQTIVQYPPIYLECTPNPDMADGKLDHWGYVFVDNEQYTREDYDRDLAKAKEEEGKAFNEQKFKDEHVWRVVHYSSGGTEMYKINVTVLPSNSGFVIGDPREDNVNNLNHEFAEKPEDRTLTYYYPTENSDRTYNMIAPSFRISTKLSGTEYGGTGLEQARYRCASFQENGFPAGRWRLPTMAEVTFVSQLSANGVFEWQFGGDYWSAHGGVNVNKNDKTVAPKTLSNGLIRCVYDTWYWGDEQVPIVDEEGQFINSFTWGDAER